MRKQICRPAGRARKKGVEVREEEREKERELESDRASRGEEKK